MIHQRERGETGIPANPQGPTTIVFNTREPKTPKSASASGTSTPADNSEQVRKTNEARAAKDARRAQYDSNTAVNGAKRDKAREEKRPPRDEAPEGGRSEELAQATEGLKTDTYL